MIITIVMEMIINFIRGQSSPLFLCLKEEIMKKYYVAWNYKSSADEIAILILDEVNDILKKNKIKIDYQYDDEQGWDYFLNLKRKKL